MKKSVGKITDVLLTILFGIWTFKTRTATVILFQEMGTATTLRQNFFILVN